MTLVKKEDESIAARISSCLAQDPLERPSFEDILKFFEGKQIQAGADTGNHQNQPNEEVVSEMGAATGKLPFGAMEATKEGPVSSTISKEDPLAFLLQIQKEDTERRTKEDQKIAAEATSQTVKIKKKSRLPTNQPIKRANTAGSSSLEENKLGTIVSFDNEDQKIAAEAASKDGESGDQGDQTPKTVEVKNKSRLPTEQPIKRANTAGLSSLGENNLESIVSFDNETDEVDR